MRGALVLLISALIFSCLVPKGVPQEPRDQPPIGDTVAVATFNIRIFSDGSRDDDELRQICEVLKRYDFIAIQEIRDYTILDRTLLMLEKEYGLDYAYVASPEVGRSVKEIYAFLFLENKVEYLDVGVVVPDPDDDFIREPFFALFRIGEFDFYVITIHSIYGDSVADRRYEAQLLDDAYRAVQNLDDENDVLLMGDFNLGPLDVGFEDLRGLPNMIYVNGAIPTSIADKLYDNIWFQSNHTQEYTAEFGVFKFDEELYGNDDSVASLAVSDHRPLWAIFDIRADDD